jgi:hypothetical protein
MKSSDWQLQHSFPSSEAACGRADLHVARVQVQVSEVQVQVSEVQVSEVQVSEVQVSEPFQAAATGPAQPTVHAALAWLQRQAVSSSHLVFNDSLSSYSTTPLHPRRTSSSGAGTSSDARRTSRTSR